MKIYLVVLESDKTSVTTASLNQFKSHELCHLAKKISGINHSVITEEILNVSGRVLLDLIHSSKRFKDEYYSWINEK